MVGTSSSVEMKSFDLSSQQTLKIKPNTSSVSKESLKILIEQVVDFDSLGRNGVNIAEFFAFQKWSPFFQMLNGPTYKEMVKEFWIKAEVFDEEAADREPAKRIDEDKSGKRVTRADFGLEEFKEAEIRSNILGVPVKITQKLISRVIGVPDSGMFIIGTNNKSEWMDRIKSTLYEGRKSDKLVDLKL